MILFSRLYDIVFDEEATATDLLMVVACLSIFWGIFFYLCQKLIHPFVYNQPWLVAAGERDYQRGGRELYEKLGMSKSKQEFVEQFMTLWPWTIGIIIQHVVGGGLCLPSILNIGIDPSTAYSLACLGILSEMAWELQDIISWSLKRFGLPDGKARVPNGLLILLAVHHSLTTVLGVPTILYYRNFNVLHQICFDLQAAAATSLAITEYTKMLDVSIPFQLRQFQILTCIALLVMVWTRGIHWIYLCCQFVLQWYHDKAWGFLVVGTTFCLIFSGFNWIFCIQPFYGRFVKFLKISSEYKSLPEDASVQKRRSSILELETAAAKMFAVDGLEEELVKLFTTNTSDRVGRRSTLPPSMFGSATGNKGRRRSLVLLRSSAGDVSRIISQMNVNEEFLKED